MTTILVTDLTNATTVLDGTGIFDVIMKSVNIHIVDQFDQGRITAQDYATVYVSALQFALAESSKFLLEKERAGLEADLLAEKIATEVKGNQAGGIVDKEIAKIEAETTLTNTRNAEQLAATIRQDAESAQKVALMSAQNTGFKTDSKLKLLSQMIDGYASEMALSVGAVKADTILPFNIDKVANDILNDLLSPIDITETDV